jgi:Ca-activated chloride channel homolog
MMTLRIRHWIALTLASSTALTGAPPASQGRFTATANLVLISATVLDPRSRPVRGLTCADFRLFADKVERTIAYFGEEDAPLSLAIVFDTSGSMAGKLPGLRVALASLLHNSNPADEFSLITFAYRPQVAVPWTADPGEIQGWMLSQSAGGRTALLDAVQAGLRQLKRSRNARRAMVIFSDGGDNYSRISERGLSKLLEEADAQLYAIDTSELGSAGERPPEELAGPNRLSELCDRAGGRYFQISGRRDSETIAEQIGNELRSHYVLGFVPSSDGEDGRFHHVQVKVMHSARTPTLSVYWRRGYRALTN